MPEQPATIRFTAPRDRGAWRVRSLAAALLAGGCAGLAVDAARHGAAVGVALALACATAFAGLSVCAFRRSRRTGPPLVIDDKGLAIDDGLRQEWHVPWGDIARVSLRRGLLARRVVIELREESAPRTIPRACHGGLPPEWLASLIDTFRERGGRLDSTPDAG